MGSEIAHHGNGAAIARQHGGLAQHVAKRLGRDAKRRMIGIDHHCRSGAQNPQLQLDPRRRVELQEVAERLEDFLGVLIGHQAKAHFGDRLGRDHGFRSGAGESAGDAVNFHGGPRPHTLQHRVTRFAGQLRGADFLAQKFLFVERELPPAFAFHRAGRHHVIVHTWNSDGTGGVFTLREQLHQAMNRIRRGAAIEAGMQIASRAGGFQFHIDQAAQPDAQSGKALGVELRVGDQRDIGLELGWIFRHELADGCAADLFFAFDQELQIDGQLALVHGAQCFSGLDVHVHLAFVVGRAAGVDVAVVNGRLKRRRMP